MAAKGSKSTGREEIFPPLTPIGDSTVIRRIIITLKQAGIDPIVVVTGQNGDQLEKHVARLNVIFLRNEDYSRSQMFDSIRLGLSYMQTLCARVFVMPAKFPLFLPLTLRKMMAESAPVICPTFNGKGGHPVLIASSVIPKILAYEGDMGLKGALRHLGGQGLVFRLPVEDIGILQPAEDLKDKDEALKKDRIQIYPYVSLTLRRDEAFFDPSMAQFLFLIHHTGSIQKACRQMHMSYTKGWSMLRDAKKQLGFPILETQAGGTEGGFSQLTPQSKQFLERYLSMAQQLRDEARHLFEAYFPEYGGGHEKNL